MPTQTCLNLLGLLTAVMFTGLGAVGQAVRVTTWDLAAGPSPAAAIEKAAPQIKALAPDVIFLHGVTGWRMCSQLAEALKPGDYRVLVCSSFAGTNGPNGARSQVGILARSSSYFSWSEPWKSQTNPPALGGFAFAAVQVAGHRFGLSSLTLPGGSDLRNSQAANQWLDTLNTYRSWSNNRLEGFVAAGFGLNPNDGETARLLRLAGFANPQTGRTQAPVPDEAVEGHLVPNQDAPAGLLLANWPMTCEFDFRPAPIIVVAPPPPTPNSQPTADLARPVQATKSSAGWWWFGGGLACLLAMIVIMQMATNRKLAQLQAHGELLALGPGTKPPPALSYNVVVPPQSIATLTTGATPPPALPPPATMPHQARDGETDLRQGLLAYMAQWLKQAFVKRLVSDRESLLATQGQATRQVVEIDERLSRLEARIQKETGTYERQIEQLSRELLTAREENLHLIRSQINLLKSEMAAARARVLESEGL